ncbi:MFS transporter [Kitasatospora sp. NPDC051853]|uniref:MFS transporter n=1 Tax=Kitasatospora sp. NPDC051853 TaxID=3364058 RepID=UPI0037A2A276
MTITTTPTPTPTPSPDPHPGRPTLRQDPGFRLLFGAAAAGRLGTSVGALALPLVAVLALDASPGQVGLLAAAGTLAFVLIGLPVGAWVDRLRRRPVMIAADLVRAALLGSVPAAWALHVLTLPQLYLVALLTGAATVFFDVAAQSHLPDLVGRDRIGAATTRLATLDAVAQIGGRSAGGFLVALLSAPLAVLLDAVSHLVSAVCLLRIRRPEPSATGAARGRLGAEVREGLGFVLGHPSLRAIALSGACGNLSVQLCQTLLPVLFVRDLGLSGGAIGLFFALGGVGALLGSLSARPLARRIGAGRTLCAAGLAVAPFSALVALADRGPGLWLAGGGWLVTTFKVGVDNVIKVSHRQAVTPERLRGRMNATMRLVLTGALATGAALAGLLGELLSTRAALSVGAAGLALAWVPVWLSPLRRLRSVPGL